MDFVVLESIHLLFRKVALCGCLDGSTIGKAICRKVLQKRQPPGDTILTLTFELSEIERASFRTACGNAINSDLPIQIVVGARGVHIKVKKPGKGAKSYEKNSVKIARFVSENFEFEHIPAIRPGETSLEVISNLLERELAVLAEDKTYKEAMDTIEQLQRPVYELLEVNVQQQLAKLLPSIRRVKIVTQKRQQQFATRFRMPELIIDDGTATPLEIQGRRDQKLSRHLAYEGLKDGS